MLVLETTPPAVPASSPLQLLNSDPLMAAMLPPSTLTVVVPLLRSLDMERMMGYGMGTGPPGLGVLQTSGAVLLANPLLPWWTKELDVPLTLIVTPMLIVDSR